MSKINKKPKRNRKAAKNRKSNKKRTTKQRKINLTCVIRKIKNNIIHKQPNTLGNAIDESLKTVKRIKEKINKPKKRVLKIPKTGGILPLIPIFAGLSALGALGGGAAQIAKAVSRVNEARQQLAESQRHNRNMETIAMGKGLYLKPYKRGLGLYLHESEALRNN